MVWCGLVWLYRNYAYLKYLIHTVEVDIVLWTGWVRLCDEQLYRGRIRIQSWLIAASTSWCVIGLAQIRGNRHRYSDWGFCHVTIDRAKSHINLWLWFQNNCLIVSRLSRQCCVSIWYILEWGLQEWSHFMPDLNWH